MIIEPHKMRREREYIGNVCQTEKPRPNIKNYLLPVFNIKFLLNNYLFYEFIYIMYMLQSGLYHDFADEQNTKKR
jgi:hypothetical protein